MSLPAFASASQSFWKACADRPAAVTHPNAHEHPLTGLKKKKRTSPAFKDVVDLSQQQGHVAELRLPGLAEHLQVLLGDLTGRVEGQRLGCRDDLSKSAKNCDMRKVMFK